MKLFFQIIDTEQNLWSCADERAEVQSQVLAFNQRHPEMIIANYAQAVMNKLKKAAGCLLSISIQDTEFENFDLNPVVIQFEELLFLRCLFEFKNFSARERSTQFLEALD